MSDQNRVRKLCEPTITARDVTRKNGPAPVGPSRSNAMLKVAERPATRKPPVPKKIPAVPQKFHTVSDIRRAQLWLDDQVAAAGNKVVSIVTDLNPELAAVLLERNPANRSIKFNKVQDYAHDMKGGGWKFNGEPIIIARDGLLNDGQHRCAAVVESRVPVKVVMVFGVERETRETLDQGIARSPGDYLSMRGYSHQNNLAAIARMLWQWRTYGVLSVNRERSPTRGEIVSTVEANPGLVKSFVFVNRPNARAIRSVSVLGFCHFAFKAVSNQVAADYFMDALIDGTELKAGDPILSVRNRLIADRSVLGTPEKAELLFRAWNAHRLEQTRVIFKVLGGELPLLEA
jgi:hypothetical protein